MRFDKKDIGMFSVEDPNKNKKRKRKVKITESQYRRMFKESSNGVEQNFTKIFNDYWISMLNGVCRKYSNSQDEAEEYCQSGFVKAYEKIKSFDNVSNVGGMLYKILRNHIIDEKRRKKLQYSDGGEDGFDFDRLDVVDEPYSEPEHNIADIKKAVEQLSPKYKKVFEMYYFENMTHNEIAERLGVRVGTSKSNLHKAKKNIKEILMVNLNEEDEGAGSTESGGDTGGGGEQWETGMSRGPANTLGNSVWSDNVNRSGPANQWV